MKTQQEIMIKLALDAWYGQVNRTEKLIEALSDEQLQNEVAPGRNRGIYLVGHLAAVHDRMIGLMDLGERLFTFLDDAFILNPDKTKPDSDLPTAEDLREHLKEVNSVLAKYFGEMKTDDWFLKHTAVLEEDFEKEPHRNKLAILITRTNHLAYHLGQLTFLKK